ncbi:MAG: TIGR03808 family TAT-translocated repetitive protein, partial [Pseudomonadota bacterium]
VFLPPGNYFISNIRLPRRTTLIGVPGLTRLIYTGNGHLMMSEGAQHLEISSIILDGANRGLASHSEALLAITDAKNVVIDNCQFIGSLERGIWIARSQGRIERSRVSGASGECGIFAVENTGLAIRDNEITNCSNNGILVHRWTSGEDRTIVTGNRISNISAAYGGTGPFGNGINVFRADSVLIANNQISDCAFSAIRSNAGNNVQINANQCLRSGEMAIYSEFEFVGATITNNVVDGAGDGISIANFMQGGRLAVCANNLVRNVTNTAPYIDDNETKGVGIYVEADTAVTGNVIENTDNYGMALGWGPYLRNIVATSNIIRNTKTGIYVSVVEGSGSTVISDNVISGATEGGIVGYRWREPVTGEMGNGNGNAFEHLEIERNRIS